METYTLTGFWDDGDDAVDTGLTRSEVLDLAHEILGVYGNTGFEIRLEGI